MQRISEVRLGNITELSKKAGLMVFSIYSSEPQIPDCKFVLTNASSVCAVLQRRYRTELTTVKWNWLKRSMKKRKHRRNSYWQSLISENSRREIYLRQRGAIWCEPPFDSWWNKGTRRVREETSTTRERECVWWAAANTNWKSFGSQNECEWKIYNCKARAGKVMENKREICFSAAYILATSQS